MQHSSVAAKKNFRLITPCRVAAAETISLTLMNFCEKLWKSNVLIVFSFLFRFSFNFYKMIFVGFLILFGFCCVFSCEGKALYSVSPRVGLGGGGGGTCLDTIYCLPDIMIYIIPYIVIAASVLECGTVFTILQL